MTIDDFEWVEEGFDTWFLIHKDRELTIARLHSFNGWNVIVRGAYTSNDALVVDSFDAAKTIATLAAANNMEKYPDVTNYRKRTAKRRPEEIPKGVFRVDKLRS